MANPLRVEQLLDEARAEAAGRPSLDFRVLELFVNSRDARVRTGTHHARALRARVDTRTLARTSKGAF